MLTDLYRYASLLFLLILSLGTAKGQGGLTNTITAISWNESGSFIVVGTNGRSENSPCNDGALRVESAVSTGTSTNISDDVRCGYVGADFSFDNQKIVAQNGAGKFEVWDASTYQSLGASNINAQIYGMELAPTEPLLARILFADTIHIDRYETIEATNDTVFLSEAIRNISDIFWSPDSDFLLGSSTDGTIGIWDTSSGELVRTIEYESSEQKTAVAWSSDARYIAFGDLTGAVVVWDLDEDEVKYHFEEHSNRVNDLEWSTDGTRLASASEDSSVRVWNAVTGELLETLTYPGPVYTLDWSPDDEELAYGGADLSGNPPAVEIVDAPDINDPPIADAGENQTVTDINNDGSESVTLHGEESTDTDGTISFTVWTEIVGGNVTQIATGATSSVELAVGLHTVTLTVTDDDGATDSDEVVIVINAPPMANAGANQTVTDTNGNGSEQVTLSGSGSSDSDGTIATYSWTEGGSVIATGASPQVTLTRDTHAITLTVTDNLGATDSDEVIIKVNARPVVQSNSPTPLVVTDANSNGSESVTLSLVSEDVDGSIATYAWSQNGSVIATTATHQTTLNVGTHTFTLTVTDNDGATGSGDFVVKVNKRPVADAGAYQYVFDNNNGSQTVSLNGSGSTDTDGTITSYVWTKNGTQLATGITPQVTLAVGTHTITLTVTDNNAATNSNTATVTKTVDPLPGNNWLSFVSKRNTMPGWRSPSGQVGVDVWNIYAARDDGYLVQITRNVDPSPSFDGPVWSPDHSAIAYSKAGDICVWTIQTFSEVCNFPNSDINTVYNETFPAWSPDGNWLAYVSNRAGENDIYRVAVNSNGHPSGNGTRLTTGTNTGSDSFPDWRNDSNWIVFASNRDGNMDLYVMPATGSSAPTRLTETSAPIANTRPAWSPNGNRIGYDTDEANSGNDVSDVYRLHVSLSSGTWIAGIKTNLTGGIAQSVTFMAWKKSDTGQNTIAAVRHTTNNDKQIIIVVIGSGYTTPDWNTSGQEDDPDW